VVEAVDRVAYVTPYGPNRGHTASGMTLAERDRRLRDMSLPQRLHLPEDVRPDRPRLGRHIHRDPASLNYMIETAGTPGRLASARHERVLDILNQGSTGSCTGNAMTGLLGTHPFWEPIGQHALAAGNPAAAEDYAVKVYSDATHIDGVAGAYPPEDTGSTGLAVCKVIHRRGLISGYRWARTPVGFVRLLQEAPVLLGTVWLEEFFEPDAGGFIDSGGLSSPVAGGHEVEIVAVELADPFEDSVLEGVNSWGPGWGEGGRFRFRMSTYMTLRDYADLKQPVL
jgi:hypothetical protein